MNLYLRCGKRIFDLFLATLGLIILAPLLLSIAVLVKLTSQGPVFFKQKRMGRGGKTFTLLKFRTMVHNGFKIGPLVTRGGDPRVTTIGRILRKTKMDELPQLINVLKGEMSFVGPRPEVPNYLEALGEKGKKVLTVKPGITDEATIRFRWEEDVLARVPLDEVESYYLSHILPQKVELSLKYLKRVSLSKDLSVLFRTMLALFPKKRKKELS